MGMVLMRSRRLMVSGLWFSWVWALWMACACLVLRLYAYLLEGLWVLGFPEGKLNMGQCFLGFLDNLPLLPVCEVKGSEWGSQGVVTRFIENKTNCHLQVERERIFIHVCGLWNDAISGGMTLWLFTCGI